MLTRQDVYASNALRHSFPTEFTEEMQLHLHTENFLSDNKHSVYKLRKKA